MFRASLEDQYNGVKAWNPAPMMTEQGLRSHSSHQIFPVKKAIFYHSLVSEAFSFFVGKDSPAGFQSS
jgi:hypothetical protein